MTKTYDKETTQYFFGVTYVKDILYHISARLFKSQIRQLLGINKRSHTAAKNQTDVWTENN